MSTSFLVMHESYITQLCTNFFQDTFNPLLTRLLTFPSMFYIYILPDQSKLTFAQFLRLPRSTDMVSLEGLCCL
jgi:hypothetical protein